MNYSVGSTFKYTAKSKRSDGLTEKQVVVCQVTKNDGKRAEWVVIRRLDNESENILRRFNSGGMSLALAPLFNYYTPWTRNRVGVSVQRHFASATFKRRLTLALETAEASLLRNGSTSRTTNLSTMTHGFGYIWLYSAWSQLVVTAYADGTFTVFDQQDNDWTVQCKAVLGIPA